MPHPDQVLRDLLDREFPDWNNLGGHDCRPQRRNPSRWSDHAYLTPDPHGRDIGVPDLAAPYADRLAWGDRVHGRLISLGYDRLGIRYVQWRQDSAHRGHHLHVSFLPHQGNKLPACKGGSPDLPAPDVDYVDEEDDVLRQGTTSAQVELLQHALTSLGFDPGVVDGVYGPRTAAAVEAVVSRLNVDLLVLLPVGGAAVPTWLYADLRNWASAGVEL